MISEEETKENDGWKDERKKEKQRNVAVWDL
jgi:hypothetical protein